MKNDTIETLKELVKQKEKNETLEKELEYLREKYDNLKNENSELEDFCLKQSLRYMEKLGIRKHH